MTGWISVVVDDLDFLDAQGVVVRLKILGLERFGRSGFLGAFEDTRPGRR